MPSGKFQKGSKMKEKEIGRDPLNHDSVWRFFASVRLTVLLLLTLAATSIIGTVVPQNESPQAYQQAFGDFLYRLFDILDIFDMYHSWWFQLLLLLLTLNVVVCSVDRLKTTWKIIFTKNPIFNVAQYRNAKRKVQRGDSRAVEEIRPLVKDLVARKFSYYRQEDAEGGVVFFAERWRWTRLGVYVVHTSVILLLIGGLIGSIFGFEGFVNIPEGETIDTIRLRNSDKLVKLDFEIRCDDFDVSFYANGMPKEFRSGLAIIENGEPVLQKDILVNHPLRYKGINFFQSSYGELPAELSVAAVPEEIGLGFTSKETGMVYNKKVRFGDRVIIPEDLGEFELKEFKDAYEFRGRELGPTLIGALTQKNGVAVEVILPLRFPSFDRMSAMVNPQRSDAVLITVDEFAANPEDRAKRYYTGLQVTKDPGVIVVYTGFLMMIVGCIITFFMSHQRICIEVAAKGKRSHITVSGKANKNKLGMHRKLEIIADQLADPQRKP
jgi:cytochrome c biogenesis protein